MSQIAKFVHEVIQQNDLTGTTVTLSFEKESTEWGGDIYTATVNHPKYPDSIGLVTAVPFHDELEIMPSSFMHGRKEIAIYDVGTSYLDKLFRSEGLGKQMYYFLIANLSRLGIALVPADYTADHLEQQGIPRGERGTSYNALRVWRGLDSPAYYPNWNPDDFKTFRTTRRRGWLNKKKRYDRRKQ